MTMIEVKTADLTGRPLDWAVAAAEGLDVVLQQIGDSLNAVAIKGSPVVTRLGRSQPVTPWNPTTRWDQCGPLIEKYAIKLVMIDDCTDDAKPRWVAEAGAECIWEANPNVHMQENGGVGGAPLVAVCRAIVLAKAGAVVMVPKVLMP